MFAEARGYSRQLPVEEYPNLVELADELTDDDAAGLFQFGVDTLLDRVERLIKNESRSSGRQTGEPRSSRPPA
jgi:hypothetical protein